MKSNTSSITSFYVGLYLTDKYLKIGYERITLLIKMLFLYENKFQVRSSSNKLAGKYIYKTNM